MRWSMWTAPETNSNTASVGYKRDSAGWKRMIVCGISALAEFTGALEAALIADG